MDIKPGLADIRSWILSSFFLRYSLTPYVAMFWEKYIEKEKKEENIELRKPLGENRILSKVEGRGGNEVRSVCMLW